jgi:hypothetical protein
MEPKALTDIATQLKRIADIMERNEKRNLIKNDGIEKVKEAIQNRKDELLRNIKSAKDGKSGRN